MQEKDFYKILDVPETATESEIKKNYRLIAKKFHPDLNPGNKEFEEKFKAASEAYDILGDKKKRTQYDSMRKLGYRGSSNINSGNSNFNIDYEEFMRRYGNATQKERFDKSSSTKKKTESNFSFDDVISNLFGGKKEKTAQQQAAQQHTLESDEPQPTSDPFFKQKGYNAYVDLKLNIVQAIIGSKVSVRTPQGKKVTISIQPGIDNGKKLRIPKMGFSIDNGSTGDLFITLNIQMPKNLTPEQIDSIKSMAKVLGLKY
ncbi:MAG: J domain-containing protein [Chlorobiota bacterium]|nr:MAG: J domain-containing protein [Chlorobiota bacterium]